MNEFCITNRYVPKQDDETDHKRTLVLKMFGNPNRISLKYKYGKKSEWEDWMEDSDGNRYLELPSGESIYFDGNNVNGFSTDESNYYSFSADTDFDVSGDLLTLVNLKSARETVPAYCFTKLFCHSTVKDASGLVFPNAETLIAEGCFAEMFAYSSVENASFVLPKPNLHSGYEYNGMFIGCANLTDAPYIKAQRVSSGSMSYMFYGCRSLGFIKTDLVQWGDYKSTAEWTWDVSKNGTFSCSSSFQNISNPNVQYDKIPENWEIIKH